MASKEATTESILLDLQKDLQSLDQGVGTSVESGELDHGYFDCLGSCDEMGQKFLKEVIQGCYNIEKKSDQKEKGNSMHLVKSVST